MFTPHEVGSSQGGDRPGMGGADAAGNPAGSAGGETGQGSPGTLAEENAALRSALLEAEARFRSTVERSLDGVIVLDREGRVRFANQASEALFGWRLEELVGSDFGFPTVAGETTEIDLLRSGRRPGVAEMRVADTTWDTEPALLVLIRDVTHRRAAEEREHAFIREQAARAEAEATARRAELLDEVNRVLGSTLDLDEILRGLAGVLVEELGDVCLIDIDDQYGPMRRLAAGRRDYPHRAVLKGLEDRSIRLGLHTPEARVFRTGGTEVVPEVTEGWLAQAGEQGDMFRAIGPCSLMMVPLHAGTLPWGVVTILSCDPSVSYGPADAILVEEIVRRAGIAIENARLYRLAQEASRAKSDFLAIVSHELRTPLSAIVGYTGLLEERIGGSLTTAQDEFVTAIRRSAEHLIRLIEQVITFARLEGDHEMLQPEDVELSAVLSDVVTLTGPLAARKGLGLRLLAPEEPVSLRTDGKKLAQILINLVTNAIKYTDSGEVRLEGEAAPGEVIVRVEDTGRGIPHENLEEIFEPFRQLEDPSTRREGGAGIGLSIVKNLTRLLGGEVGVESRVGAGTTFSVRLPREHVGGVGPASDGRPSAMPPTPEA